MARILVIDDEHAVRLTLQVILERDGHEVICAADGDQGLRAFADSAPQLIITDIIMPNKEGIETIMEIRARDATTPIIAMSGGGRVGNSDFLKMAARLGANDVLAKPFERHELTAAVNRLLSPGLAALPRNATNVLDSSRPPVAKDGPSASAGRLD